MKTAGYKPLGKNTSMIELINDYPCINEIAKFCTFWHKQNYSLYERIPIDEGFIEYVKKHSYNRNDFISWLVKKGYVKRDVMTLIYAKIEKPTIALKAEENQVNIYSDSKLIARYGIEAVWDLLVNTLKEKSITAKNSAGLNRRIGEAWSVEESRNMTEEMKKGES